MRSKKGKVRLLPRLNKRWSKARASLATGARKKFKNYWKFFRVKAIGKRCMWTN